MPIYGIDLGTTNSIIGINSRMSSMVPSVADLKTGKAGANEYKNFTALRNYKVDMQMSKAGTAAVAGSTCVLRELKNQLNISQDEVIDAVISVPAYFGSDQCNATIKAAKLAGINVKSLIKEPTAAAIFLNKYKDGVATIFDLGGGTLDVSVIRMDNGKATVLATDGCILGGRDLDREIGNYIQRKYGLPVISIDDSYYVAMTELKILRAQTPGVKKVKFLLPNGMKTSAGKNYIWFSSAEYAELVVKVFKRSIDIAKSAINASGISMKDMSFYFIGGSTHCPFLRNLVEGGLGIKAVECDYDRDMAVANGAVYYAGLIEQGVVTKYMQDASRLLAASVDDSIFMQPIIYKNTGLPIKNTTAFLLADCDETVKTSYKVDIFYGDCSMNVDMPENNNSLIESVVIEFNTPPVKREDTLLVITSILSESGELNITLQVPLQKPIHITRRIAL